MDRFCRDCRSFVGDNCVDERNMRIDLVRGDMRPYNSAAYLRQEPSLCGNAGAWFEPQRTEVA